MARTPLLEEERRSYSALFVFLVGLLIAGAVWAIWDDNISRRPWKKYQTEFYVEQAEKIRQQIRAEEERLSKIPEYVELRKSLREAEARLENPETKRKIRELERKLAAAKLDTQEWDLNLRIVKSRIEEAWYEYDHAVLTGHGVEEAKAELERLEREREDTERRYEAAQAEQKRLEKELGEVRGPIEELRRKIRDFERQKELLEQRLGGVRLVLGPFEFPKIPKIEQVVLAEFDRGNFDTPLNRVDRCHSCHIAITKAGFENEPHPLRTHPHIDPLLRKHPIEKFGCTPCHAGQGPAVNSPEQAHGEVRFWDYPLLRGEKVQSSCLRCHVDTRHLPHAETAAKGQVLFEELGCHNCHLTEGYENFGKVGPYLRRIGAKVDPDWLVRWVENPHDYRPRTRMPNFEFGRKEAVAIAAYLLDSSKEESRAWLESHPEPSGVDPEDPDLVARGKELVDSLGCRGCHGLAPDESPALLGESKDIAPNLSRIAEKTSGRWLYHWLRNPRDYSPVSRMPSLRLSDEEARAVASYLLTLGRKPRPGVSPAELRDPETIREGERLVRKYGCAGCHDIVGMEKESRIGVELSTFASKPLEELFFGYRKDIPRTWDDWTYHKLENPRTYATDRVEQLMPNFHLTDGEIRALRVFLASRVDSHIPEKYLAHATPRMQKILKGRRLVARYNCVGCHVIEGEGGAIRRLYENEPNMAPPVLTGEGAKVQAEWLFAFLKEPVPIRPWLRVRMPTFHFSDEEATALVEYFAALDGIDVPFAHMAESEISPDMVEAGKLLASEEYFSCFSCHMQGDRTPEGSPEEWAPDLAMARERLRPDWIPRWLEDPQALQPGTKMPSFYPGGPEDVLGGDEQKQREALRDYLWELGREARLAAVGSTQGGPEAKNSTEGGEEG
ncbi:MAG: hypothetical protein KatS3mg076_0329 [Candidatus Binatia bacterium]|nr:MAG: hypothetical protein KatS3mg076_0329 [Candidatus Binatia bacterium]